MASGNGPSRRDSRKSLAIKVAEAYVKQYSADNHPNLEDIEQDLCENMVSAVLLRNSSAAKEDQWRSPSELNVDMAAIVMTKLCRVVSVEDIARGDALQLAMYVDDPEDADFGIYTTNWVKIRRVARKLLSKLNSSCEEELRAALEDLAPQVEVCKDADILAMNNGLWNYRTRELEDFSPDTVFLAKSPVDVDVMAQSPHIQNPDGTEWCFDDWLSGLFNDDAESVQLAWEMMCATLRPNHPFNRSVFAFSHQGGSGKSCLGDVMEGLVGTSRTLSIKLEDMAKNFKLQALPSKTFVVCHENGVGNYIDSVANLKAMIDGSRFQIDVKYGAPMELAWHGFVYACLNELPLVRDHTGSWFSRIIFLAFPNSYRNEDERPYISEDYLRRPEVLRYVVKHCLVDMDLFDKLSEPDSSKQLKGQVEVSNNSVLDFLEDVLPQLTWNGIPWVMLYELYVSWNARYNPSGRPFGKNSFMREARRIFLTHPELHWAPAQNTQERFRSSSNMVGAEPVIVKFGLENWMNRDAPKHNRDAQARPAQVEQSYKGIVRLPTATVISVDDVDDDDDEE